MASIVNRAIDTYNYINTDLADPRTNNFFLVSSPWPVLGITALYLYFCTSLGPRYMSNRQPYILKDAVLLYNVFQVLMSTYLFYEGSVYLSSEKFNFACDPVDYSDDPVAVRLASGCWWYFFSKITEFLDTIFFVLKKKNSHISFLHVYHHSIMALMTWVGVKYIAGGHVIVMGTLNAFVHVTMYTYYLIAALGPQYQKYIWWKKHVTILQLVQFILIVIHNMYVLSGECTFPKFAIILMTLNAILFINLFGRFFYANYIKGTVDNGSAKNKSVKNGSHLNGSTNRHSLHDVNNNGVSLNGKLKDI